MGISVGCQRLSRVANQMFSDLKGKYVFNFTDDFVVYSPSVAEYEIHLREVFLPKNRLYPE
jgi:hypothetical protein